MAPFLAFSLSCLAFLPSALGQGYLYKAACERNSVQDNGITASICRQINKEQHNSNDWYWYPADNECRFHNGDDPKQFGGQGWRRFTVLCGNFKGSAVNAYSCTYTGTC